MAATPETSDPRHELSAQHCPHCRGSGQILLLTSARACEACGGKGRVGAALGKPGEPSVASEFDARGRLVSQEWSDGRYRLRYNFNPETGRPMSMHTLDLEPRNQSSTPIMIRPAKGLRSGALHERRR